MHCRDCGAELLSADLSICTGCGRRLGGALAGGDEYGPGRAMNASLRTVTLLAALAVLAAATVLVSAVV